MNLVVKDRDTNHMMQLPLPIKHVLAVQLDEQGYVPVGAEAARIQPVMDVLLNAGMNISQFNRTAKLTDAMNKAEAEKFFMAVVAFYPLFAGYPDSYLAVARAAASVFTYDDCNSFHELGRKISAGSPDLKDSFRAGLRYASKNIVGFYGGKAVVLRNEDYCRAEEELSHDSDDCSEIETE